MRLLRFLGEQTGGVLLQEVGIFMHSSGSNRTLSSTKVVGRGDGHHPGGPPGAILGASGDR